MALTEEQKAYKREYYKKNKHQSVEYRKRNQEKINEYNRNRYDVVGRDVDYKRKYGISIDEYNKMFEEQNGCCAICGEHQTETNKRLVIDHNHITGDVRKLLCSKCNVGLGMFKDNPELLEKAAQYIRQNQ